MWVHLLAVLALGALCGAWVLVQRLVERHAPGRAQPTGGCGGCAQECETTGEASNSRTCS